MELTASYTFNAPVQTVWDLLMDTNAITRCLPGARGLRATGDDRYEVDLDVGFAAIAGSFKGTVAIEEKAAPVSYTMALEGSGRQGFVKGRARVSLSADGDRTRVDIAGRAEAGGMIARLGQRLLEGAARTMMDRFFTCLSSQLGRG